MLVTYTQPCLKTVFSKLCTCVSSYTRPDFQNLGPKYMARYFWVHFKCWGFLKPCFHAFSGAWSFQRRSSDYGANSGLLKTFGKKSQLALCRAIPKCDLGRAHSWNSSQNTVRVETSVSVLLSAVAERPNTSQVPSCHVLGLATCTCSFMLWRQHTSRLRISSYNITNTPKCEYTEE